MSGYKKVNYYQLCRLCTSTEGKRIDIFREEGRRRSLQSKIETLLSIRIEEEDSLPKIICNECLIKLESYIEFRESALRVESMLEGYFTSSRFSDDFLKEGKVYIKTTDTEKIAPLPRLPIPRLPLLAPAPTVTQCQNDKNDKEDKTKMNIKISEPLIESQIIVSEPQNQHQQPVLISNLNPSNIQIISGVPARAQQYKCAMQIQPGVVASTLKATAGTQYSYQKQTTNNGDQIFIIKANIQPLLPDNHHSPQRRLNEPQLQVQNQLQNIQNQRLQVQQQQSTIAQTQIQQLRDYEKRQMQIQKEQQNQVQIISRNNNVLLGNYFF